jgi:hypothetical protein
MEFKWNAEGQVLFSRAYAGDPLEEELMSFLALPRGWHYGQGRASSFRAVIQSLHVIATLRNLGVSTYEVFPAINGEVMISAYCDGTSIDITTTSMGKVTFVVENNGIEIAAQDEPTEFSSLLYAIDQNRWLTCASSDSSILGTIATKRSGFPQLLSTTRTTPVFQWWSNRALPNAA